MEIIILGTSNAWGANPFDLDWRTTPLIGTLSNAESVRFRKYCTSLLIRSEKEPGLLVDCGPDFARQLWEFRVQQLSAILLTHSHWDHIAGLDYLYHFRRAPGVTDQKPRIPVYGTEACLTEVLKRRGFQYLVQHHIIEPRPLSAFEVITLGSLAITPFAVEHNRSAPGAVGFIFAEQKRHHTVQVLYSGDFYRLIPPDDRFFRRTFDLVILECNQWLPRKNGHTSFQEIVEMLQTGPLNAPLPRQLTLVHFGEEGPKGPGSSFQDWRQAALNELQTHGLEQVAPDPDVLIGYEGLRLRL